MLHYILLFHIIFEISRNSAEEGILNKLVVNFPVENTSQRASKVKIYLFITFFWGSVISLLSVLSGKNTHTHLTF